MPSPGRRARETSASQVRALAALHAMRPFVAVEKNVPKTDPLLTTVVTVVGYQRTFYKTWGGPDTEEETGLRLLQPMMGPRGTQSE